MKFDIDMMTYDSTGLIPAIIQDAVDNEVLMMAYMNRDSLLKTIKTGETWFWSRSRKKFWHKGETSGHVQKVKELYYDCDADTLLIKVEQVGRAACHEGYRSCFHYRVYDAVVELVGEKVFNPEDVYGK